MTLLPWRKLSVRLALALAALSCAGLAPARAGQEPAPNPLEMVPVPEDDPGPAWLRPGMRLTYTSSSRTRGGFLDRPYAGAGYTQITVVGLDAQSVALETRSFTVAEPGNPATLIAQMGVVGTPGHGSDWWINPALLKQVREVNPELDKRDVLEKDEMVIVRVGFPLQGKTYKAIRFKYWQRTGLDTLWVHRVYDEGTGILLYRRDSGKEALGDAQVAISTFANCRQLPLPWAEGPAPSWVRRTKLLGYDGQIAVSVPGMPPAIRFLSLEMSFNRCGNTWAEYAVKSDQAQAAGDDTPVPAPSKAKGVSGSAQIGGLWLPPHSLGALRAGQVLDADPFTKFETKVASIGRRADGLDVVVITEGHAAQQLAYTYDRGSGILLEYVRTDAEPQEVKTTLRLTKRQ